MAIVEYPYTNSSQLSAQITDNGFTQGVIRIYVRDKYGNPITGKQVALAATNGAIVTPATAIADSNGFARFNISSKTIGATSVSIQATGLDNIEYNYGSPFTVTFKAVDTTPPTISRYTTDKNSLYGRRLDQLGRRPSDPASRQSR